MALHTHHFAPAQNEDGTLNMVVEVPKWTRAKLECATNEPWNPIKQDTKRGALRQYGHGDMPFNYGFLPQTWEDPEEVHPDTGARGDGDPLDVLEVGARAWPVGAVLRVKPLGVLAMLDGGETDWKLLTVAVGDASAPMLGDVGDLQLHMPGALPAAHRWLSLYKWPDVCSFAFQGQAQNRAYALQVVAETHAAWRRLVAAGDDGGCRHQRAP